MTHWCRDIPRDEAVRAAEDGRQGPLPTLEQCIDGAKAMMAGPSGLRTKRVTLEITHYDDIDADCPRCWNWTEMLSQQGLGINESVRVVEDCLDRINMGEVIRERDAAIRERDELRKEAEKATALAKGLEEKRAYFRQSRDDARAECERLALRVADLESQLESVACRAATAETENEKLLARVRDWERVHQAAHLMASLESAPAASGAANSSESPKSSEPVAYWVQWKTDTVIDKWTFQSTFPTRDAAAEYIDEHAEDDDQPEIVPFYTSPPPARGWLTEEEREALERAFDLLCDDDGDNPLARTVQRLLARSTPPEVVLPGKPLAFRYGDDAIANRDGQWRAALAAAGVTVTEANR